MTIMAQREVVEKFTSQNANSNFTDRKRSSPVPVGYLEKSIMKAISIHSCTKFSLIIGQINHGKSNPGRGHRKSQARTSAKMPSSNEEVGKSQITILPRGAELRSSAISGSWTQSPKRLPHSGKRYSNRSPQPNARAFVSSASERTTDYSSFTSASSSDETKQEINYAGALFHSPPAATVLPKPPTHWMNCKTSLFPPTPMDYCRNQNNSASSISAHIKGLLKVPVHA